MKILIYTHVFAPKIGGVETYVKILANGLTRDFANDTTVTVVTPTSAAGSDDQIHPFRVVRHPGFWKLVSEIWAADVVHVAGPCLLPMLIALVLRRPVAVEHHGYQTICPNGLLLQEPSKTRCPGHFAARRYDRCFRCMAVTDGPVKRGFRLFTTVIRQLVCARVAFNLPITQHVAGRLGLPRSRVVYYGISGEKALGGEPISKTGGLGDERPLLFAFVGRLVSEKGLPLLIEAAGRLFREGRSLRVLLIGDGPERKNLQEHAVRQAVGDCVEFTGYLTGEALKVAMQDVAAVVMPSIWEETAGLAAIEHMMRGRLVIAADIGGLGEVVGDTGLKFAAGDVDALTACMKRAINEPELAVVLGKKAKARAEAFFGVDRMIAEHGALYRELLGREGGQPVELRLGPEK